MKMKMIKNIEWGNDIDGDFSGDSDDDKSVRQPTLIRRGERQTLPPPEIQLEV